MPVYEFFCPNCNTIFSFFSRTVNTAKIPVCPKCSGSLEKQVSLFSCVNASRKETDTEDMPIDEKKLSKIMAGLEAESGKLSEEDPRQAAALMKKLTELAGVKPGSGLKEAMDRLAAGEDPEKIEQEMGDALESDDLFQTSEKKVSGSGSALPAPQRDETLYDL